MAHRAGTTCAIGVMAKAPQAGRCKTRLCPPLSPEQAATLSAAFLRDTTENIAAAARLAPIAGYAAFAPAGAEALVRAHVAPETALLLADGSGPAAEGVAGFGRCLLDAIAGMLAAGHPAACVLSSDTPTLPTRLLVEAATLLLTPGDRAVFGAADDGGYYLLGLRAAHAEMFARIAWSTATVADETRDRARAIGLPMIELDPWHDVDDAPSLARLFRDGGGEGYAAPVTHAAIARLGLDLPAGAGG